MKMLRYVTPEDCSAVPLLLDQLGHPLSMDETKVKIIDLMDFINDTIIVCELDGVVIGYVALNAALVLHFQEKIGTITSFVIAEPIRRQGVGSALMEASLEWFTMMGCKNLLVTSASYRSDVHALYEAHGFVRDGCALVKKYKNRLL